MERLPRRRLVAYAPRSAFAPWSLRILGKLGYEIELHEESEDAGEAPDLWIADERRLESVPADPPGRSVPLVLLTGRTGASGSDARVAAAVKKPAGLHDLYRVFQELGEDTPRAALRAPAGLRARCRQQGREWEACVTSLSESGCLLRSDEPLALGSHLAIEFPLPKVGPVATDAEAAYQLPPDFGLVFHATSAQAREAINQFVLDALSTA